MDVLYAKLLVVVGIAVSESRPVLTAEYQLLRLQIIGDIVDIDIVCAFPMWATIILYRYLYLYVRVSRF